MNSNAAKETSSSTGSEWRGGENLFTCVIINYTSIERGAK